MDVKLVFLFINCVIHVPLTTTDMNDPCFTSNRLNDWRRSVTFPILPSYPVRLCDNDLANGWYRITSCAGDKMQTSCPSQNTCGTHSPIWLTSENIANESLYPEHGETVTRSVCASYSGDCCSDGWRGTIKIKDCSSYYVYYLSSIPSCSYAYCFGDTVPSDKNVPYNASTEDPDACFGFEVDGNWSDWTPWTACSVSCGGGMASRHRMCTNPKPEYGGLNCTGNDENHIQCNLQQCQGVRRK